MDPTYTLLERVLGAAQQELRTTLADLGEAPSVARLTDTWQSRPKRATVDWTRLRGFVDWLRLHPEQIEMAIATPPARTGTPIDAVLAAMAEKLADDAGLRRPRWTASVPPLETPWEPPGTPRMIAAAKRATPQPFRARNVFIAERALWRVQSHRL